MTLAGSPGPQDTFTERALSIMLEVADSMSSAEGVEAALSRLAWLALRATGADRSAILTRDPKGTSLLPSAGASKYGNLESMWDRFRSMEPVVVWDELRQPRVGGGLRATTIEDVADSQIIPEAWKRAWGSKSIAFAPLKAGGELFGLLAVDYVEERHAFTDGESKLIEAIAGAAGVALQGARLVERSQRAAAVERRLAECTAALRAGNSLTEMLDFVAGRFTSLLPEASCAINVLNSKRDRFRSVAWRGMAPRSDEISLADLPADEIRAIETTWTADPRAVVVVEDLRTRPGWGAIIPPEIGTGMLVPLVEEGEILGFVAVGRAAQPFTPDEIRVASAFADQAALALAQARLNDTLQVRLKLIEALYRVGDAIVSTSDLKAVLALLNESLEEEMNLRCTSLAIADPVLSDVLRLHAASPEERALIRAWRREGALDPIELEGRVAVPVPMQQRPAGVLWLSGAPLDPMRAELIKAIAAGIGEVATKAKLRRTAERRGQELAIAADRERIARDLHDTVGQTMYGIGLKLQDILFDVEDPAIAAKIADARALAAKGVADVRSAVHALSFLQVRERGFLPSLRALTTQFSDATGIEAQFKVQGAIPRLREEVENALYRMTHEALVNVERHARATGVVITLVAARGGLTLSIRDDGVGVGQRDVRDWRSSSHFGMRMMSKLIEDEGGRFIARAGNPRGLLIEATFQIEGLRLVR